MAKAGLLFVGTADGLVLFSNPNNIGRWLKIGQPFRGQAVRAVWPLADNPLLVLAAVEGAGLQRSDDGGQSWQPALAEEVGAIGGGLAGTPTLYVGTIAGAAYRSDDDGASWSSCAAVQSSSAGGAALIAGRSDARSVYLALRDGSVWSSGNSGASWQPLGAKLPAPVAGLVESQAQAGELYAVAGGGLYRWNGQSAWQALEAPDRLSGPITALAGRAPVLLAALAVGGIGRSDDGGMAWSTVGEAAQIDAISAVSYHIDSAYAGGADGTLIASSDRGRTWEVVKTGLPPIKSVAAARLI